MITLSQIKDIFPDAQECILEYKAILEVNLYKF